MPGYRLDGVLQYQQAGRAAAVAGFLDSYRTTPRGAALIRDLPGDPSTWTASTLSPRHPEGCRSQVTLRIHVRAATFDELQTLRNEVEDAIYHTDADCDSSFGMVWESD